MRLRLILGLILCIVLGVPFDAAAATLFYYTSSPTSWVGHGETVLVSPEDGFNFLAYRNSDNGVGFKYDGGIPSWWNIADTTLLSRFQKPTLLRFSAQRL